MKKFLILCCLCQLIWLGAGELLLRFGAISDNHLDSRSPDSWQRTKLAFELFRKHKVQFFVDAGDVSDTFQPEMFRLWRKMYLEVFSDAASRPDFLMIPAGHDKSGAESTAKGYAEFVRLTGSGAVNPVKVINGIHFVSLAQWQNVNILKRNLDAAVAATAAGRPVFVVTHVPPKSTTGGSGGKASGDAALRTLLNKYPQVIVLSGHNHSRLIDARSAWQGEFTAVNLGSLAYCGDGGIANFSSRPKAHDAAIVEVYRNRVVFRRFNVKSGEEVFPEKPWQIPLPFSRENSPLNWQFQQKNAAVPAFKNDAVIGFKAEFLDRMRWGVLEIPLETLANAEMVSKYRVEVVRIAASGERVRCGMVEFARCALPASGSREKFAFPAGYLEAQSNYLISVIPYDFWGRRGNAASGKFRVGAVPWKEVPVGKWEFSGQPWKTRHTVKPDAGGFVAVSGDMRFLLPRQAVELARSQHKQNVIITLDIECIGKGKAANLRISNDRNRIISPNTGEYREKALPLRYSFIFQPDRKSRDHYLLIRRGSPGKYRFSNLKCCIY